MQFHTARANEIIKDSKKIENLEERVLFLIKAKGQFTANNSGWEVPMVVSIYDSAIDETKFRLQQLQDKATTGLQTQNRDEKFIDMANIEKIKEKAIEETVNFFVEKHAIKPDRDKLLKLLEGEKDLIDTQLKHNSGLINRGRKSELLTELENYITGTEKLINKIRLNEGGYVANSKPENVIDEFCFLSFYYLFHSEQVYAINNLGTTETQEPPQETTEQKIKRILEEPLRGAFDTPSHLDKIAKALAEYEKAEDLEYECRNILISNKIFYEPFFEINKTLKIPFKGIAEVLHKFIYSNNGSRNAIKITSILQNFKRTEYKRK
jgi:hypothetical protein